jgi:hypothetical protein
MDSGNPMAGVVELHEAAVPEYIVAEFASFISTVSAPAYAIPAAVTLYKTLFMISARVIYMLAAPAIAMLDVVETW